MQVLMMKCPNCGYTWKNRVETPKRCPACQEWLIEKPKPVEKAND